MGMGEDDVAILLVGGLIGVVSGVVASIIFTITVRILRPRVVISDLIADEDGVHRIKVVNRSRRDLVDVSVHVYIERSVSMPGDISNQVRTRIGTRFNLDMLPGRNRRTINERRARYARLIRLDPTFRAIWSSKGEHFPVLFVVTGRDAISGVTRSFEKRYGEPSLSVRAGVFKPGDSLDLL